MAKILGFLAFLAGKSTRRALDSKVLALELAGIGAVSYGLWLAWHPLGFIALGGFALYTAWRMS